MKPVPTTAVLAAGAVLALAGCGSSSKHQTSATTTLGNTPAPTTTASATATAPASNIASKSAPQILASAEAALSKVHSFHFQGVQNTTTGVATITGEFALPGGFDVNLDQRGQTISLILAHGVAYFRASASFWRSQSGANGAELAKLLANRWLSAGTSALPEVDQFVALTNPATVGRCVLGGKLGTLSVLGSSSVSGQPAIVLAAAADKPGTAPGRLYVAATGQPLPLRIMQTGGYTKGVTTDPVCHTTPDTGKETSTVTLTDYNAPVTIAAPAGAVSLARLEKQG
ncbi:MAG TPA: hypothetical protein VHX88_02050 [Solirubrobacteraceae bacterium]|jgi:hypothetical protein|nr:hypothetical protein [Solirubrobacteraceae bacterium]